MINLFIFLYLKLKLKRKLILKQILSKKTLHCKPFIKEEKFEIRKEDIHYYCITK